MTTRYQKYKESYKRAITKYRNKYPERIKLQNKNNYSKNRELRTDTSKEWYQIYKRIIYNHYGHKCVCCGETTPMFLTIDHVNNDGFLDKTSGGHRRSGAYLYRKIIKEGFPDKYQVMCFNCNLGRNINGGLCPHNC